MAQDISGCGYTDDTFSSIASQASSLGFVDDKKNREYHQPET